MNLRNKSCNSVTPAELATFGRPKPISGRLKPLGCSFAPLWFHRPLCAAPVNGSGGSHLPLATCQHKRYLRGVIFGPTSGRPKYGPEFASSSDQIYTQLLGDPRPQLKLVMDSINWAFRHTERNIAETGLNLLLEMMKNFQMSEFCNQFYRTYYMNIEQKIFAVLTDTFHKPGFKLHVDSGSLIEPLWDASTVPYPYPNNMMFVRDYTIKLLGTSFPNMTVAEVVYPTFSAHFPWPRKHSFLSVAPRGGLVEKKCKD
uniref:Exportin-1 C-terminal domain-containing protein n=1 Tax=Ananas comosus var. bracteatus TaxID=296719 RepID=A0A6V7PL52_ANACO|nr:unnamed protein product [Ananas comosus var. bracteatus]